MNGRSVESICSQQHPASQQGVALISMLLVFALVVILVSGAVARMGYDIRKTSYHLMNSQAYQYALGGEALARQILHQDWVNNQELSQGDSQYDNWYQDSQFEPDNGKMRIRIRDLESRFNLNNLVTSNGEADTGQVKQFQRMLGQLSLPANKADAILDWLDKDTQPRNSNSEDVYFQSLENDYRSADAPMSDASELYALNTFKREELVRIMPEVIALPEPTSINPNTASEAVLASLHPQLNAKQVIQAREKMPQGFASNQAFMAHTVTAGLDLSEARIDVHSQYFLVSVAARYQDHTTYLQSVVHRDPQTGLIKTLSRNLLRPKDTFSTDNPSQSGQNQGNNP
ncbi:type II secretion system minor pseudopilin GspK [Pseudomaricurvus sp.]|uniref:type II secretion system minor pseudopilin GspK n=1 Tax=Pseudomaricurvus sp. TaxID=2004510 RepID=UPI003F6B785C